MQNLSNVAATLPAAATSLVGTVLTIPTPDASAAPAPAAPALASRAMLRGVTIRAWDGRKLDRKVSDEVTQQKGAASDTARVNKQLLPKEAFAKVGAAYSKIRAVHARYCLPWTDNGLDILPAASVMAYDRDMRAARMEFDAAADEFAAAYPALVQAAPARLGDLFDPADFPDAAEVRARFSVRVRTLPMPEASDFRVDMSEAQARAIRAEIEAESQAALDAAMKDAWQRIADVTSRMVERLNAFQPATKKGEKTQGIFRDSLVENIRDLVAVLPAFNLTNSPDLDAITKRMERELCAADAAELRDNAILRKETAAKAQAILDDVSAFLA